MQVHKKNILSIASRFYLVLLYVPFFIVQGFINFDSHVKQNSTSVNTIVTAGSNNLQKISCLNKNKSPDKKVTIRLNKRFQQEDVPILSLPNFELAVYFITANLFYNYPDPLFLYPHLLTNNLRGPPVIA